LAGAPARAIESALALEPGHAKALWLKASLAHEERRYADALATWRQLQALVPPGSSDAKIIQANIAEASRLAAG
jgi:cytochrome c-type biogenesis protein CcmH